VRCGLETADSQVLAVLYPVTRTNIFDLRQRNSFLNSKAPPFSFITSGISFMKYNTLGRTGISVSEICLGTMTWGTQNTEAQAHEQMDYAVENGVNFFDTAELYPTTPVSAETQGLTEDYIGTWFQKTGKRKDVVLATKVAGSGRPYIRNGRDIDADGIREAVDTSLKRLRTDYIDLYQVHWPNRGTYHFRPHTCRNQ